MKTKNRKKKLHQFGYEPLTHRPYSRELFLDFKGMLAEKKFSDKKEANAKTLIYFDTKIQLYNKNDIKKLEERYNRSEEL